MINYSDIRHVHLEITTRCNAACPGCPRNLCGVNILDDYPLHSMSLEEAKRIFTPAFLNQIDQILINGNLGDFVVAKDGLEIVKYFKSTNQKLAIEISTNASARPDIWVELAKLDIKVSFCIDGLSGTHELYRTQTDWNTVISNAKKFIEAGGQAVWKMILFHHNQHEIEQCRELSKSLGFNKFLLVDHGRNEFPVYNQRQEYTHYVGENTRKVEFVQLHKEYKESTKEYSYPPVEFKQIYCQAKKNKSVYIAATGEVYPCCWLGFYPRQMAHYGNSQIVPLMAPNNANTIGIEESIKWFNQVEQTWSEDQLYLCNTYCGVK